MSIQGTSVSSEQRGYGRGLILGLTMAESMLLLVFCLLLAAGAIIIKERKQADKALLTASDKQALEIALAEEKALTIQLSEKLKHLSSATPKEIDESWRELEIAKRDIDQLKATGLTLDEINKHAPVIIELRNGGITPAEVVEASAVIEKLQEQDLTTGDLEKLTDAIKLLREKVIVSTEVAAKEQLAEIIRQAEAFRATEGDSKPHEWPPIINLSETKDYFFESGSALLSPGFRKLLAEDTSQRIAEIATKYEVDVIEVIGHTDEQKINGVRSNLDAEMKGILDGTTSVGKMRPGDNAGLGLARAMAVAEVLNSVPELEGLTILPMSGAQLILPGDRLTDGAQTGDVQDRRRIEIRVRKRNIPEPSQP
ncbi:hypothetical protein IG197_16810 [Aminobacter sp. SR38]|jgi:flagellar motor protein MotB|uniref:hypothetical protein n=1 Tax=Aminobacter sp. SR38 TaxID=2774562 RepID=UPI00177CE18D|nr:hypothetical protein [Aminobacter sp. SR38]QOF69522.1 hypothetical protein IG197_16810 [Aminobacter sp. SR38]